MLQLLTTVLATSAFAPVPQAVDQDMLASLQAPSLSMMEEADDDSVVAVAEEDVPNFAQNVDWTSGTRLSFSFHYAHLFNSKIDDDMGEFDLDQLRFRVKGNTSITDDFSLAYGFRYEYDGFNFAEDGFFGAGQPWSDIHTVQFNLGGIWSIDDHWSVFAGGVFRFARETDADWGDSLEAGGAAAVSYRFSDTLTIGGGLGVITQLEDDPLFYPVIIVDWEIIDRLVLTTRVSTGWANETGIELVYHWTDNWDVGIGAAYDYQRFRINDEGPIAGGVGEFTALPFFGFVNWKPLPAFNASIYVGVNTYGEFKAVRSNGSTAANPTYGMGFMLGAQGTISF